MTASEPATYDDALVERLNVASLPYRDPVGEIPWDELDPARPWLPEHLVSIYGLPEYAALAEEQRLRLTQVEFVATAEFGLWLESLFLSRFTYDSLHQLDASPPAYRYQLHELREEVGHSLMFLELMRRSGIPMLTPIGRRVRLAGLVARLMSAQSPLFRAAVFVGEAVPNHFNHLVCADRAIPVTIRAIVQLHMRDETRHIAYARLRLAHDLPRLGRGARAVYGLLLRVVISQFVQSCFYPAPAVYAAAGIEDAQRLARAARRSASRAALVEECLGPVRRFLREQSLRV